MKLRLDAWIFIVGFLLLLGAAVTYQVFLWDECRGVGHSWLYCLAMVTR